MIMDSLVAAVLLASSGDGSFVGDVNGQDGYTSPQPIVLTYDDLLGQFVGTVSLRAERDGAQSGRTYEVMIDVEDAAGNIASASCCVVVPHDKRKQK
jgi:hypothetical protein